MAHRSNFTRPSLQLALAAVFVLAGGSLSLALAAGAQDQETPAAPTDTVACGGCRCGQAAGANPPDGMRPGRGPQHRGDAGSCGQGCGRGRGKGAGMGAGMGMGMRHGGRGAGGQQDLMQAVRALVHDYRQDVVREVQEIDNGIITVTRVPDNPEGLAVLQRHVGEMQDLLASGGRIRGWDPLFREIFDHHDAIDMKVETLSDGVRVTETSADPEVVKLIQAHARKVDAFIARGPEAVHEPTPLPPGYRGRTAAGGDDR